MNLNKSPKGLNKLINIDSVKYLKHKNFFKKGFPKRKSIDFNLKRKLNGKRLNETNSVKYLGIRVDSKLNWKAHINDIAFKLIRANAMLCKVRDFNNAGIFKAIDYALFESHIDYACIIWVQNVYTINRLFILQKKASRKERNTHTDSLFFKSQIVLEIVFWSANMSKINYLSSFMAGLHFPPLPITMKPHLQPMVI